MRIPQILYRYNPQAAIVRKNLRLWGSIPSLNQKVCGMMFEPNYMGRIT
jgi:hypothetical protein